MKTVGRGSKWMWRVSEKLRLACERLRSYYWRLRGAHIGAKCLFGKGVRLDRPWSVSIGRRCAFQEDVWFDIVDDAAEVNVGDHVFMGRGVQLLISDGISIGDHVLIGAGVKMADHKHNISPNEIIETQGCNSSRIEIGSDVMICVNAVILQGVKIGEGAIVGPGAIVSQDVAPYAIVGSPPARVLGSRHSSSGCSSK